MTLIERFRKLKNDLKNKKFSYGKYWENAKKTFEIDFDENGYKNYGSRDYFPELFHEINLNNYQTLDKEENIKIVEIGSKSFVLGKRAMQMIL